MSDFELGGETTRAPRGASIALARTTAQMAADVGVTTTCCGVRHDQGCKRGCRNYRVYGAAPQLVKPW